MTKSTGKPKTKPTAKPKAPKRHRMPGRTLESLENQIISQAIDLAAKQIRNGTASAQVITHFLKLGSTTALLEKAKLEKENKLLEAKTEQIESQKKVEELYANALAAMSRYSGKGVTNDDD